MVRVTGFEPAASCAQTRRDTNFAMPRYLLFRHDTTASDKNKDFSVCGHLCGQSRFCAAFGNRGKSSKHRCHKALRGFALLCPGYRHGTPKAGALHLDIQFPDIMVRQRRKLRKLNSELCSHRLSAPRSQIKAAPSITAHWPIRSGTLLDQSTS